MMDRLANTLYPLVAWPMGLGLLVIALVATVYFKAHHPRSLSAST